MPFQLDAVQVKKKRTSVFSSKNKNKKEKGRGDDWYNDRDKGAHIENDVTTTALHRTTLVSSSSSSSSALSFTSFSYRTNGRLLALALALARIAFVVFICPSSSLTLPAAATSRTFHLRPAAVTTPATFPPLCISPDATLSLRSSSNPSDEFAEQVDQDDDNKGKEKDRDKVKVKGKDKDKDTARTELDSSVRPKTGWPHNLPGPESSFWSSSEEEEEEEKEERESRGGGIVKPTELESDQKDAEQEQKRQRRQQQQKQQQKQQTQRRSVGIDEAANERNDGGFDVASAVAAASAPDSDDETKGRGKKKKNDPEEKQRNVLRTGWLHNTVAPSERGRTNDAARTETETLDNDNGGGEGKGEGEGEGGGGVGVGAESPARRLLWLAVTKKMRRHRILNPPTFHPCGDGRTIVVTEHVISVPLVRKGLSSGSDDYDGGSGGGGAVPYPGSFVRPPGTGPLLGGYERGGDDDDDDDGESSKQSARIDVYFVVAERINKDDKDDATIFFSTTLGLSPGDVNDVRTQMRRADSYVSRADLADADSMILYLQGGPGFGAPSPISGLDLSEKGSWAGEALSKGYDRVVLMDQRGTGRSSPITKQTLERKFPGLFALDGMAEKAAGGGGGGGDWKESIGADAYDETDHGGEDRGKRVAEQLDKWESLNPDLAAKVGVGLGQAAEYVACFRADSIVEDAEDVKEALLRPLDHDDDKDEAQQRRRPKPRPYGAVLGQSFGGFCVMTYLSLVPHPPKICLFTGGIAPMLTPPIEVYDRLWDRVRERNLRYYERYPGDVALVKRIVRRLLDVRRPPVRLPSGGILTARRFLQLGLGLGGSPSAFASLHDLISGALLDDDGGRNGDGDGDGGDGNGANDEFARSFLKRIDSAQPFDDHPLYFLLHESIYADGDRPGHSPTDWAAHRALRRRAASSPADRRPPSEFDYRVTSHPSDGRPTMFFGEMVFPWMSGGDYAECGGFGMMALAQSLAAKDDWSPLYDEGRMREALIWGRKSRAAAAVYYDDMYVDFDCSLKVAARDGPLEGCKVWITNDYQHSGLRDDGATIFGKLLGMAKGSVGTPS